MRLRRGKGLDLDPEQGSAAVGAEGLHLTRGPAEPAPELGERRRGEAPGARPGQRLGHRVRPDVVARAVYEGGKSSRPGGAWS